MIGTQVVLPVLRESNEGLFLDGGELGEVLLPKAGIDRVVEREAEVFLYHDSDGEPTASLQMPTVMPGSFGKLDVLDVGPVGAFLDWGLPKDLLLPHRESKGEPRPGRHLVVSVFVDEKSGRIVASQRIDRELSKEIPDLEPGQEVEALLFGKTEMGYKAVVNNSFSGLFYLNQVFKDLRYGQTVKAYVKEVRSDRKLDLSLYPLGKEGSDSLESSLMEELKQRGGYWAIDDKTPADQVYQELGVSKKAFKRATGSLYKQRKISFEDGGIRLLNE